MLFCCQCVTLFTQYHLVLCHTISHHPPDPQILALFQRFSLLTTQIFIYINFLYISRCSPKCSTFVLLLPESHPTVSSCILAKCQKHLEAFFIKAVLKHLAKFTRRYLQWALFLSKVVKLGLDLDRSWCFPMNLTKFLRTATL